MNADDKKMLEGAREYYDWVRRTYNSTVDMVHGNALIALAEKQESEITEFLAYANCKDLPEALDSMTSLAYHAHAATDSLKSLEARIVELEAKYTDAVAEGLRMYARWKDGVQYVGTSGATLNHALTQLKEAKDES